MNHSCLSRRSTDLGPARRRYRNCRASSAPWDVLAGPCDLTREAAMPGSRSFDGTLAGWARPMLGSRAVRAVAYLGLCAAYLQGGFVKLADFPGAVGEMAHFGLAPAPLFAVLVIALELAASAMILTGWLRGLG